MRVWEELQCSAPSAAPDLDGLQGILWDLASAADLVVLLLVYYTCQCQAWNQHKYLPLLQMVFLAQFGVWEKQERLKG